MKQALALVLLVFGSSLLFGNEINLRCVNNNNSQDIKAVIINSEKKKFFVSANYLLLRFDESEISYMGIHDEYIASVTTYDLNRITLQLTYTLIDKSWGQYLSGRAVSAVIDKKEYSCNQVTKI